MELVEIRLNTFLYRFRRLTWREEAAVRPAKGEDARDLLLAHALHDISGLPVTSIEDAKRVIRTIPKTLRWRIWVVYRGKLPEDRYFSTRGLYEAPDHQAYNKRLIDEGDSSDDPAEAELVRRFGVGETREAHAMESRMMEQAMKSRNMQGR